MLRTKPFAVLPWDGGLNTALDSGLIPNTDLVQAENIIFDTSGARIKRGGFAYFDTLSVVPATLTRSSSGTTRTIIFASTIKDTGGTPNHKIVVGETFVLTNSNGTVNTNYGGTITVLTITTTNVTNDTITFTHAGSLSETAADANFTFVRADPSVALKDFFYFNPATSLKSQQLISATLNQVDGTLLLYRYDASGRRVQIPSRDTQITAKTFLDANVNTSTDIITITAHGFKDYDRVLASNSGGALPAGIVAATDYYVIYVTDNTIQLAASQRDVSDGKALNITSAAGTGTHTLTPQVESTFSAGISKRVNLFAVNERLLITFDAPGVKPRLYEPTLDSYRLMTDIPDGFCVSQFAGRTWMNDKTNLDFIHWSAPQNPFTWLGFGDSGGMYVGASDGDPEGITTIFPSFKGRLIVTKRRKTYQITGNYPEEFNPVEMSSGIGSTSPQAIAPIELDDLYYMSERGIHSVTASDQFGDFNAAFLSGKIQPTFNAFERVRFKYSQAVYNPAINSAAFAVTENGQTKNSALYLLNIERKEWYVWTDVDAQSLALREEADGIPKIYYGTSAGRIVKTQSGELSDFGDQAVVYRIKSGTIYPAGDAKTVVGFKKLVMWYRPKGSFSFTVKVKIDNFATQTLSFSQSATGAKLGVDFYLGMSVLAFSNEFAPFTKTIDGFGRGCTIQVEQTGTEEEVEIWGFGIDYESAEQEDETKQSGGDS